MTHRIRNDDFFYIKTKTKPLNGPKKNNIERNKIKLVSDPSPPQSVH